MKSAETTLRLTLAALGAVVLLGAGAAAGVDRGEAMMNSGIVTERVSTAETSTAGVTETATHVRAD